MSNLGTNPIEALRQKIREADVKLEDILAMDAAVNSLRFSDEIVD